MVSFVHENKFKNGNVYELINNIYKNIINYSNYSKMQTLDFIINTEAEMNNNTNLSCNKKAIMQMKLIELSINYLKSFIKMKGEEDIKNMYIMKKTKQEIELDHKRAKAENHKKFIKKRMGQLVKKIEEKNKKLYFLPGRQVSKYNMVVIEKQKLAEKIKKKGEKNILKIEDFLYDEIDMKSNSMENVKDEFDLDSDEKEESV